MVALYEGTLYQDLTAYNFNCFVNHIKPYVMCVHFDVSNLLTFNSVRRHATGSIYMLSLNFLQLVITTWRTRKIERRKQNSSSLFRVMKKFTETDCENYINDLIVMFYSI